jgi:hypothetical protein
MFKYINSYFHNIKKKPIKELKNIINTDKLIKKKLIINNHIFNLYFYNKNSIVEYTDYNDYYNKNYQLNKLLYKSNLLNIILIWFIYINNKYIPILITKYIRKNINTNYIINEKKLILNYNINESWISAGKTRNYSLNDPLIDYLEYHSINSVDDLINIKKRKLNIQNENIIKKRRLTTKTKYNKTYKEQLLANGIIFENQIFNIINSKYKNNIVCIIQPNDVNSSKKIADPAYFQITIDMIKKGIPIIYQGVLHDKINKIYGAPDLIIRADYINKIFNNKLELYSNVLKKTNQLPYYIIDIKKSTLHLTANNDNILNNNNIKPYKSQIAIYYKILNKIQDFETEKAFILPYKCLEKSVNNIFKLGIIDFKNFDKHYLNISSEAIEWIKLIRNPNNKLNCLKPNNINLYPNMSNYLDDNYREIKKYLAEKNQEITNIWMCGYKNRLLAIQNKIYNWSNPKLNSSIMNINGKNARIIDMMLDFNRNNNNLIYPKKIKSNYCNWRDNKSLAFYIDFETINCSSFEINYNSVGNLIFMIGIGYTINNKWNYECFIVEDLSDNNQIKIINDTINFIKNICNKNKSKLENVNICHWSSFEPTVLNNLCSKYNIIYPNFKWFNIIKLFHEEPIFIKGALNFSLKSIGKAMYNHKLIDIIWDDSDCTNGLEAMIQAYNIYNNSENIYNNPKIITIRNYNYIDCKIMWKILNSLNKYA